MNPINEHQFLALDSGEIAARIDEFFLEDHISRYGLQIPPFPRATATEIWKANLIQALTEPDRRKAILLFYRAAFQSALCSQYSGIENLIIHTLDQSAAKWRNPHVQILRASTRQAEIMAARISFECLMEFVYFVENRTLIPKSNSKSKISTFRKWLCAPGNKFGWLIFYLLVIYRFDRSHRTPEVHGTSYIAIDALRCAEWPRIPSEGDAAGINLNIWRSVVETLNGQIVNGYQIFNPRDEVIFKDFFSMARD